MIGQYKENKDNMVIEFVKYLNMDVRLIWYDYVLRKKLEDISRK